MPAKVTTLSECFHALRTLEGSLICVLAEMVTKIAAFPENTLTAFKIALKELLHSFCNWIMNFNSRVPGITFMYRVELCFLLVVHLLKTVLRPL